LERNTDGRKEQGRPLKVKERKGLCAFFGGSCQLGRKIIPEAKVMVRFRKRRFDFGGGVKRGFDEGAPFEFDASASGEGIMPCGDLRGGSIENGTFPKKNKRGGWSTGDAEVVEVFRSQAQKTTRRYSRIPIWKRKPADRRNLSERGNGEGRDDGKRVTKVGGTLRERSGRKLLQRGKKKGKGGGNTASIRGVSKTGNSPPKKKI